MAIFIFAIIMGVFLILYLVNGIVVAVKASKGEKKQKFKTHFHPLGWFGWVLMMFCVVATLFTPGGRAVMNHINWNQVLALELITDCYDETDVINAILDLREGKYSTNEQMVLTLNPYITENELQAALLVLNKKEGVR
jgi:ABC-type Fe3+ transport system permease subunit